MTTSTLKLATKADPSDLVQYEADELFPVGKYRAWKKGEVTSPRWLKRNNGFDYVMINDQRDMANFEKYLAQTDPRLAAEFYNTFTTGSDKNGNPMLVLSEMNEFGDMTKRVIVVVPNADLARRVVAAVDHFCGESDDGESV